MDFQSKPSPRRLSPLKKISILGGHLLGVLCILGGIVLFLHGFMARTGWIERISASWSRISDASSGGVFFIAGFVVIYLTRFILGHRD